MQQWILTFSPTNKLQFFKALACYDSALQPFDSFDSALLPLLANTQEDGGLLEHR
jgi:hypothetical protein